MGQEKNNKGIITLLLVLVVGLIVLCALLATGTINLNTTNKCEDDNQKVENVQKESIHDVVGAYTAQFENLKSDGDINTASITLNLYDNGVFTYVFNQYTPLGTLGNYFVDGDTIVLKYWFNSDSGTGLHVTGGTKILTINSDGSITDNIVKVKSLIDNDITSITLVSGAGLTQFDLSSRLGAAFFTENGHKIFEPAT